MRFMLRVLGWDLLEIEASTDRGDEEPPRSFGFHASGPGQIERADDLDDRPHRHHRP